MIAGYEIADFLAWDVTTWDRLLSSYHRVIWPAHIVAMVLLGLSVAYCVRSANRYRRLPLMFVLAACWAWIAWLFHAQYHAQLNWAAHYWVGACLIQSILLLMFAFVPGRLVADDFAWRNWVLLLVLSLFFAVLIGAGWRRPVMALSWPLLSPDVLAWVTLLAGVAWARIAQRTWLAGLIVIVPTLVLIIDGLVAYSLPATDRVIVVMVAFISTLLALRVCRTRSSLR